MITENFERCKDDEEDIIEDTTGLKKHGTELMVCKFIKFFIFFDFCSL